MKEYEEIHDNESTPVTVGVDLAAIASTASQNAKSPVRGASGITSQEAYGQTLVSFMLYWSGTDGSSSSGSYKVYNPKVVCPDGSVVTASGDTVTEDGTYYCHVTKNEQGAYVASISSDPTSTNDVATVCLFNKTNGEIKQYHVGMIILGMSSVTGQQGSSQESEATPISGDVTAKGETNSGLVVKTYKSGETKIASVDIAGRSASDVFAIKSVKKTEDGVETEVAKIFATDDIELPSGGASGEMLTDVEIELSGTNLRLVKTYTDIADGTTRTERSTGITVKNVDVVTSSQYAHKSFSNNKKQLTVLEADTSETPVATPVFTAIPHSENT